MVKCTDRPVMTIAVDWDVKQQNKPTNQILYKPVHKILVLLRACALQTCVHCHIVELETYCVRYALVLLQLNVYKSSKVSSEAL